MKPADSGGWILRIGFLVCGVGLGVLFRPFGPDLLSSALASAVLVLACLLCDRMLRRAPFRTLLTGSVGLLMGLCLGGLIVSLLAPALASGAPASFLRFFVPLATGFLGLSAALAKANSVHLSVPSVFNGPSPVSGNTLRYVDTSALIDGRVADLVEAGFLDGVFVIPQFVLNELQTVADSPDTPKRTRGRRGLDIVARLQRSSGVRVEISPIDYRDIREVDLKLVEAAKHRDAQIVTTDFNLSKLAEVQGIRVLNVNELASALRPVVLGGETLRVFIAREGKEPNQGVAYLEDGTMVVVESARRHIGKAIDVLVTGVVQNPAGKMIFATYEDSRSSSRPLRNAVPDSRDSQAS